MFKARGNDEALNTWDYLPGPASNRSNWARSKLLVLLLSATLGCDLVSFPSFNPISVMLRVL
jgi:hypothetical protein